MTTKKEESKSQEEEEEEEEEEGEEGEEGEERDAETRGSTHHQLERIKVR